MTVPTERVADVGALTAAASLAAPWLVELNVALTAVLSLVGIVVGVMSALYYYEGWRERRNSRGR